MKKIVIIGSSGAGKTTLARALGEILQIEVIHLDLHFWHPKWKEKPREIRRQIMQELVEKDQWIIEGSYLDTSDIRLKAADTIIFLDMPNWLCLWRVLIRYLKHHKEPSPALPEGCPDKLSPHFLIKVLGFPYIKRNKLYAKLHEFQFEKKIYAFRSQNKIEHFLLEQRQETLEMKNTYDLERSYASVNVSLA